MENGMGIDPEKSCNSDRYFLDKYEFVVDTYFSSSVDGKFSSKILFTGDIFGLQDFLMTHFHDHLVKEELVREKAKEAFDTMLNHEVKSYEPVPVVSEALVEDIVSFRATLHNYSLDGISVVHHLMALTFWWYFMGFFRHRILALAWTVKVFGIGFLVSGITGLIFPGVLTLFYCTTLWSVRTFIKRPCLIACESRYYKHLAKLISLWYGSAYNSFVDSQFYKYRKLFAITAAALGLTSLYFYFRKKYYSEARITNFRVDSEHNAALHRVEEELNILPTRRRTKPDSTIWNEYNTNSLEGITSTQDAKELYRSISTNIRPAMLHVEDKHIRTHVLGLEGTIILFNRHAMLGAESADMYIATHGGLSDFDISSSRLVKLTPSNTFYMGEDMMLADTGSLAFRDIIKHFIKEYPTCRAVRGQIASYTTRLYLSTNATIMDPYGDIRLPFAWQYVYPGHMSGCCGLPVLMDNAGVSAIVGVHVGGGKGIDAAFASILCRDMIEPAVELLRSQRPYPEVFSRNIVPEREVVAPSRKSPFMFENFPFIDYCGKLDRPTLVNLRSQFHAAPHHERLSSVLIENGLPRTKTFWPPMMKAVTVNGTYISPENNWLRKANRDTVGLDDDIMRIVIDRFTLHIITMLEFYGISQLSPITLEEAINGIDMDAYTRRINVSTSAADRYPGIKAKYLPKVEDETREPVECLKEEIALIFDAYANRQMAGPVFMMKSKDEMREFAKAMSGETRKFTMTPWRF
jgi:hypothetical protein